MIELLIEPKWDDCTTLLATWNCYKNGYKSFNHNKVGTSQYKKPPNPPHPLGRHPFNIIVEDIL